jgi:hypothetical protein
MVPAIHSAPINPANQMSMGAFYVKQESGIDGIQSKRRI